MAQLILVDQEWLTSVENKLDRLLALQEEPRPDPSSTLSVDEVAEILQISPQTVYRYGKEGKLQRVKLGSKVRFRREDVDAFLAGGGA